VKVDVRKHNASASIVQHILLWDYGFSIRYINISSTHALSHSYIATL
jgi:hypothetical protein